MTVDEIFDEEDGAHFVEEHAPALLVDYYAVLGIAPDATPEEIEIAWSSLGKTLDHGSPAYVDAGVAYALLSNLERRVVYDRTRAGTHIWDEDFYGVLGVNSDASLSDIEAAWAKRKSTLSGAAFLSATIAHRVLSYPKWRERYDLAREDGREAVKAWMKEVLRPSNGPAYLSLADLVEDDEV